MIFFAGTCNSLGCQPPQVNQQEYLASAEQYSYSNVNFRPQQQNSISAQGVQSGFYGVAPQYTTNNQGYSGAQNINQGQFTGTQNINQEQFTGTQNANQGQYTGGAQDLQYSQGNQGFPAQYDQNQGAILRPEATSVQKITYVNAFNDSSGRPIVEQVNATKTGDGATNITISKTEYPNSNANQQGYGLPVGGGIITSPQADPGYLSQQNSNYPQGYGNAPQQNQNMPQEYPSNQGVNTGGFVAGAPNPVLNDAGQQQQQPQRLPGQLIGANGVTTGGVVMAPNGQGVPLLVSPDYLQNNRRVSTSFIFKTADNLTFGFNMTNNHLKTRNRIL